VGFGVGEGGGAKNYINRGLKEAKTQKKNRERIVSKSIVHLGQTACRAAAKEEEGCSWGRAGGELEVAKS